MPVDHHTTLCSRHAFPDEELPITVRHAGQSRDGGRQYQRFCCTHHSPPLVSLLSLALPKQILTRLGPPFQREPREARGRVNAEINKTPVHLREDMVREDSGAEALSAREDCGSVGDRRDMRIKFILPALVEAQGRRCRPINYSLFPPLGRATLAGYVQQDDVAKIVDEPMECLRTEDAPISLPWGPMSVRRDVVMPSRTSHRRRRPNTLSTTPPPSPCQEHIAGRDSMAYHDRAVLLSAAGSAARCQVWVPRGADRDLTKPGTN
jgi:hypothetical protein